MKVQYKNNTAAGPGHGKLIFSEILAPEEPWRYSLQRASDQKYATLNKDRPWVEEIYYIESKGEFDDNGNLILFLDPVTVDNLDLNEGYRVTLKGEDGSENTARLRVSNVIYSNNAELVTPDLGKTSAVSQPEIQPEPAKGEERTEQIIPERAAVEKKAETPEAETAEKIILPEAEQPKNRKLWRWILLAILLLCLIAWYFLDKAGKSPENSAPVEQRKEEPARQAMSVEESVRNFFTQENRTAEAAMKLAEELKAETPADQDAIFRLYYFAADQGNPAGIWAYGQCYDPASPQWGTIPKDGELALQLYGQAA